MTDKFVNRSRLKEVFNSRYFLVIWKPEIVFEAQINQAEFTYPEFDLTYDNVITGAYTDIKPDMTVLFGSRRKGDDLGRGRIRTDATVDTVKVGRASQGTHDGEMNLDDDIFITVLNDYRVWSKIPLIQPDGSMFKDTDIAVGTFHTDLFPVANGGPGVAGFVDPITDKLRVVLPPYDNTSFAADGSSITYQWILPTGVTLVGGTLTSSQISVDCDPGRYWVDLEVTDGNGNTHVAHIPIAACSTSGEFAPFENFEIVNHTITKRGQNISFRVHKSFPEKQYPDGTLVMLWEEEYHNGEETYLAGVSGREHMRFVGWHDTENLSVIGSKQGIATDSTFACLDVAGCLARLPAFSQLVIHKNSPSDWTQMYQPDIDKYLHYLLHWHSTALDLADFTWADKSEYTFTRLGSEGSNLYDQVNKRAEAIIHNLVCDTQGRLKITPNPNLQDEADRTPVSMFDFGEHDIESLSVVRRRHPNTHWIRSGAFIARRDKVKTVYCIAPGYAPGQGAEKQDSNEMLVLSQSELNIREGHRYALKNRKIQSFNLQGIHTNYLGIEPADQEWVQVSLSPKDPRRLHLVSERFLVDQINIAYSTDKKGMKKSVNYTLTPEVIGTPAQTVLYPEGEFLFPRIEFNIRKFPRKKFGFSGWPGWKRSGGPMQIGPGRGVQNVAIAGAYNTVEGSFSADSAGIFYTTDFQTPGDAGGPTWTLFDLEAYCPADPFPVQKVYVDPFSSLYVGAGDAVRVFAITQKKIYRNEDFFNSPLAWIEVFDFLAETSGSGGSMSGYQMYFPATKPGWVLLQAVSSQGSSTYLTEYWQSRGTNGGTWVTAGSYSDVLTAGSSSAYVQYGSKVGISHLDHNNLWVIRPAADTRVDPAEVWRSLNFGSTWFEDTTGIMPTIASGFGTGHMIPYYNDNLDLAKWLISLDTAGNTQPVREIHITQRGNTTVTFDPIDPFTSALAYTTLVLDNTLKIHPKNDSYIYSVFPSLGIYSTRDAGASWIGDEFFSTPQVVWAAIDDPEVIYGLGFTGFGTTPPIIGQSYDLGVTWDDKTGNLGNLIAGGPAGEPLQNLMTIFGY